MLTNYIAILIIVSLNAVTPLLECSQLDAEVLILGAGMSGVNAANTLYEQGITNFIILEAKSEIGGRVMQTEIKPGVKIELGANWIQGLDPDQPELHPLYKLAQRCGGIQGNFSDFDSIIEYNSSGAVVSDNVDYDRIETAYSKIETISATRQANGEVDIPVRQALIESNWTVVSDEDKFLDWFEFDFCFAEPPQNSSLFQSQPLATYTAFGNADNTGDFMVTDQMGYGKLVECLAEGILGTNNSKLKLNEKVRLIKWSDECVCVETDKSGVIRTYCASYAIITFSIGVLQSVDINMKFEPDLPQWKLDVINMFSMAHYLKIYAEFPTVFWDNFEFIAHISSQRGYFPVFISQNLFLPPGCNILHITLTGEIADRVALQNKNDTKTELVQVLRGIYGPGVPEPTNIIMSEWLTDPYVLGSFSNIPVGVTDQAFSDLAAPIGRLYFSGEATSAKYNGFLHGAYLAGRDSANAVLEAISGTESVVASSILVISVVFVLILL